MQVVGKLRCCRVMHGRENLEIKDSLFQFCDSSGLFAAGTVGLVCMNITFFVIFFCTENISFSSRYFERSTNLRTLWSR